MRQSNRFRKLTSALSHSHAQSGQSQHEIQQRRRVSASEHHGADDEPTPTLCGRSNNDTYNWRKGLTIAGDDDVLTRPDVGRMTAAIRRSAVVLPAPSGPTRLKISPRSMRR